MSAPEPVRRAAALLKAGKRAEALKVLKAYLRANPSSEEAWYLLSFVLTQPAQQIRCLEEVLRLNPENEYARARLEKIQSAAPRRKARAKRSGKILLPLLLAATAICLGAGLFILRPWERLTAAPPTQPQPVSGATPTAGQTATPLPTPTASATASPTPSVTPTPTVPTPTATPVPATPTPDAAATIRPQIQAIETQVAQLRGLDSLTPVEAHIISPESAHAILERAFREQNTEASVDDQALVLTALGLLDPTYDLYGEIVRQLGEGLGGFYFPWSDELYVLGTQFGALERLVYAHEYTHALADQHYHLEEMGVYPICTREGDYCAAVSALVEGEATYLMWQWAENYATPQDEEEIAARQDTLFNRTLTSTTLPPPYLTRLETFRYQDGYDFIDALYAVGRWKMVDIAYAERLPQTSEQILHPDKYTQREVGLPLEAPPLADILGPDWRFLGSDTLGELGTQMVLGYGANYLTQLDQETVTLAAEGWNGDRYQAYYHGKRRQTVLAAQWAWDSPQDAAEFWDAMQQYLTLRYRGLSSDEAGGLCWEKPTESITCIFQGKAQTLWLIAPDLETITRLKAQYPSFP